MKYTLSTMILVGLAGFAGSSAAQTVAPAPTQSLSITLKPAKTPVAVATPVKPAEQVTQKAATQPRKVAQVVATPDVLQRPVTPKTVSTPAPAHAIPMPMTDIEQRRKE
jgi:hypothetical protein